jgi:endo-1,4-beta-xylanase
VCQRIYFLIAVLGAAITVQAQDAGCSDAPLSQQAPFPVGAAINTEKLRDEEKYWTAALKHFNSFTPEKVLKPDYLHPAEDSYYFTEADELARFCAERRIRLHGHTLIWHKALPVWMHRFRGNADEWDTMMKTHIQTIVSHFKGRVASWDVVNEAFNDDGSLRDNVWLRHIGPSYIEKAFTYAREADPKAMLFYNDYGLEENGIKFRKVLELCRGLLAKGIIDGIGMQMHVSLSFPSNEQISDAAQEIAHSNLLVHYAEVDVSLAGHFPTPMKKLRARQKTRMKDIVEGFMNLPVTSRFGITFWGVGDDDSWITEMHYRASPLLFDKNYKVKPAFCGFVEGIGNAGR